MTTTATTTELPADLVARGYKLSQRDDGSYLGISARAGVTERCTTVDEVIEKARRLVSFLDWMEAQGHK